MADADVVVTASRPRALEQLGLGPALERRAGRTRAWVAITGYGDIDRVAFGDDAAAAGGLVTWDAAGPCFVGDAIADPLTGLAASAALLAALRSGGTWRIRVSMADVAAGFAGIAAPGPAAAPGAAPAARRTFSYHGS